MWSWEPSDVCHMEQAAEKYILSRKTKRQIHKEKQGHVTEHTQFLMAFSFSLLLFTQLHFCCWGLRHPVSFTINSLFLLKLAWVRFLLLETQRLLIEWWINRFTEVLLSFTLMHALSTWAVSTSFLSFALVWVYCCLMYLSVTVPTTPLPLPPASLDFSLLSVPQWNVNKEIQKGWDYNLYMPEAYEQIDNGFISPNLPGCVKQRVRKQEGLKWIHYSDPFMVGLLYATPIILEAT